MQIKRIDKKVDKQPQKTYTDSKEFFEFKDLSGLPKGVREAMTPLKEEIRKVALGTIKDAVTFIENPKSIDRAIVLKRLQKLYRLLGHLEGETDGNLHNLGPRNRNPKGEVLDSPVEIRGMDNRRTAEGSAEQILLDRLKSARDSKGAVLQPGTPNGGKV